MIVFVNGASCTGKTSLARALQTHWPVTRTSSLLYWSLDAVISQLPFHLTGPEPASVEGFPVRVHGDADSSVGVGSLGVRLNELSAQHVRRLADSGFDVVVDYVLLNDALLEAFERALADIPVLFVGLFCDLDILSARNAARADRAPGLAACQQSTVHFCRAQYDLELDSSQNAAVAMAEQIIDHLAEYDPRPGMGDRSRGDQT